jgi:hypothetical protein
MARKTYYVERLGIRVDGYPTITAARKAWETARDQWCDISTSCPPYVLAFRGHVLIVVPKQGANNWEYTLVTPQHSGVRYASCYYGAKSQIAAIVEGLSALAQAVWSRNVPDDGALFDEIVVAARITAAEARHKCSDFVYLTSQWRAVATVKMA